MANFKLFGTTVITTGFTKHKLREH